MFHERIIRPPADVRRERHALQRELYRTAEADRAAVDSRLAAPGERDGLDLGKHPVPAAFPIGASPFAPRHALVLKQGDQELASTDVQGQSVHGQNSVLMSCS